MSRVEARRRAPRRGLPTPAPFAVFTLAFVLLLAAGITVVLAQIKQVRGPAYWSIGLSVAAAAVTAVSLLVPRRR